MKIWKFNTFLKKVNKNENGLKYSNSLKLLKTVWVKPPKALNTIESRDGILKNKLNEALRYWEEHFKVNSNRKFRIGKSTVDTIPEPTEIKLSSKLSK